MPLLLLRRRLDTLSPGGCQFNPNEGIGATAPIAAPRLSCLDRVFGTRPQPGHGLGENGWTRRDENCIPASPPDRDPPTNGWLAMPGCLPSAKPYTGRG